MRIDIDIPKVAPVLLILSLPLLLTMHPLAWALVGLLFLLNVFGILVTLFRLLFSGIASPPDGSTPPAKTGFSWLAEREREIRDR